MQPLVEVRDLSFGYGGAPVLDNISLHLHRGQFAALVGPSGAGKTSLLKLILGSLRPLHGSITISGRRVEGGYAPQVGYVPQVETVDWNFPVTVEQVVMMGRVRKSSWWPWPSAEDRRLLAGVLRRLEIEDLARRHIRDLSGGQQQRVFLARALIAQPELLVLDEPTSGVDMRTAETVLHLLAHLNRQGITILMTTHDLNAAAAHAPWVICLNRSVIAEGQPETVFTEEILNRTYAGDMIVVRQAGLLLVHQRPHPHTYRDLLPDPVLGHPAADEVADADAGAEAGASIPAPTTGDAAGYEQPARAPGKLTAKEATGELAA
jgi:zinc/manganese transport system ATP-binding protein/zinc transport system ATP-binding protein